MGEVHIILRQAKEKNGTPHITVDCVPNLEDIPNSEVKALVRKMLEAAGVTHWRQVLDVRKADLPPFLRLTK